MRKWLSQWRPVAFVSPFWYLSWVMRLGMLFIVPRNRKPSSATAWLMLIFLFPFIGLPVFLMIGSPKLSRRRRAQQRTISLGISEFVAGNQQLQEHASVYNPPIPARYQPLVRLTLSLGSIPAFTGNTVELIAEYAEVFRRIAADIDRAERFVHVEYFALSRDQETEPVFAALARAQQRGVHVRVLMDHLGSRKYPNFRQLGDWLDGAGIDWHVMLPVKLFARQVSRPDLRNHRKIVVIDGAIGYTGSQNLIQRNYFRTDSIQYDELVARVHGPVAAQLHAAFLTDWYGETNVVLTEQTAPELVLHPPVAGDMLCQVLPSGSGFENDNNLKLFTALIHAAQRKIVITNPYFVPDDSLMIAITSAAQRGVDVTLINSEVEDQFLVSNAQRSYYEELLASGVKIYWYAPPILLHSKCISIDDDIAVVGSSNLDMRSFQLNMEVTLVIYDPRVVTALRRIEEQYLWKSRRVNPEEWAARTASERLSENIARLTAALQ